MSSITGRRERLFAVEGVLKVEYDDGYKNGVAEGYRAAERIFIHWFTNHQLVEPHPIETLEKWSRDELAALKAKLS